MPANHFTSQSAGMHFPLPAGQDVAALLASGDRLLDGGDLQNAVAAYRQAVSLAPEMVEAHFKCGVALHRLGALETAADHYRRAIRLTPHVAELHFNLAHACTELNHFDCAETAYREAIRLQPDNPTAFYNLGLLYKSLGRYADAVSQFERALRIRPDYAEALVSIGLIWRMQNRLEEALICFDQGVRCDPGLVEARYNIGLTYQLMGETAAAREHFRRLLADQPDYAPVRWIYLLALPLLYDEASAIQRERQRFSTNLQELIDTTPLAGAGDARLALQGLAAHTNYFLAYQGQNDLALQKSFGRLVVDIMAANYPQWSRQRPMPPVEKDGTIRIGFVSACMYAHTVGLFLLSWLRYLGRPGPGDHANRDLEIFCYHIGERTDELTARVANIADHFQHFHGSVNEAAAHIDRDRLHLLVHADIGVTPATTQLAGLRLAPVQCAFWGHPVTTGLPTIDYFLSSELMEPADGASHYAEKLVRLPGLAMHYRAPALPEKPIERAAMGIAEDAVVYLNSQSLFKYLPQHDDIFPRIARETPGALFVFFAHESPRLTNRFKRRLESAFEQQGVTPALLILPRQNHMDFLGLNMAADVFLDTFEWSGGQTTLDALACDLPVVTLPGPFMRGRQTYGYLRLMGVTQTVAADKEAYVRLAIRLGSDPEFRESVRDAIRRHKSRLFEAHENNGVLADFFRRLAVPAMPAGENLQALFDSAGTLSAQGRLAEAEALYRQIIAVDPDWIGALNNLAYVCHRQGRTREALQCYRDLVQRAPDMAQARYNLGSLLRGSGQYEEALVHLQRAVTLQPDYAEAWNNLALTWKNMGEMDRSLSCFDRAVALAPKLAEARWNRSFVSLLKEDYESGWLDFLWRFAIPDWRTIYPHRLAGRRWDGTPLPGQTILVHDEQGLGDTLQFVRYLPLVRARCGRVVLETRKELIDLLRTAGGIDQIIERSPDGRPGADYHAYTPLMNLPLLFRTTRTNIPNQVPYLSANPVKADRWRCRWPAGRPRVGLIWAGRPQHTNDRNRSIPLAQLAPLLELPGIDFIGLQKGPGEQQMEHLPPGIHFTNIGAEFQDFSDTAACLANLDLVITVDTAVAHLAGAMGRPVWMLVPFVPDWRWGLNRSDTQWYPTMRLFRQPGPKNWAPVIAALPQALTDFFSRTGRPGTGEVVR